MAVVAQNAMSDVAESNTRRIDRARTGMMEAPAEGASMGADNPCRKRCTA